MANHQRIKTTSPRLALLAFLALAASAQTLFGAPRPPWTCYVIADKGGSYSVDALSKEAFVLHAKRTDANVPKTGALAIGNVERDLWTHNKVALSVRSLNGKRVEVAVTLSYPAANGEVKMVTPPSVFVSGRAWRELVFALDQDYRLGDRSVRIKQAKIGAWISHWKAGEEGGIEVKNFRLCGPDEVVVPTAFGPNDTFRSVPAKGRSLAPKARADALKVFFAYDNEDVQDSISTATKGLVDKQQFGGFGEVLLKHLDGKARRVSDLQQADVIVYSRCRPHENLATAIAKRVREEGVPLFAASEICDPAVEELLPCTIGHDAPEDLPRREPVSFADAGHPLAARGGLNDAPFGIYRTIAAKPGARVVMRFADGTPALVEGRAGKGAVLYSMLATGSSLVPGKESPDAFFVRALAYLTGRDLPERDRPSATPDAQGWYAGVGKGSFGRFGWEVGNGLLAEDVGSRLTVRHGSAVYEFAFPRTKEEEARGRAFRFAGDRVNQLSLGGELAIDGRPAARVDMSLGYPGVRWEIRRPQVELHLRDILAYAAVPLQGGVKVFDVASGGNIPAQGWTAPWILLFNGSEQDAPLLLVFQHRLARLDVLRTGDAIHGLALAAGGQALGVVVPTWPYGSAPVNTSRWAAGVPAEALARVRTWYPRAFRYPVDCEEHFRLLPEKGRIAIRSDYAYAETADDWKTPSKPYAPVPPTAFALADATPANPARLDRRLEGPIVRVEPGVEGRGLATRLGEFADRDGVSRVVWAPPLPVPDIGFLPHALGYPEYEKIANEQFAAGATFTCGGGVKVDYVKDKRNSCRNLAVFTLNMHIHLLGLCKCTPNPFIYTTENRRIMRRRLTWRFLEPLETMQYRMACRWRREPVSGSDYAVYMNSPRHIATRFEPEEYGSKVVHGDANETVRMIFACLQVLEDRMGQRGLVKANWDAISRHVASYEMLIDDWAYLASGCIESGGPASYDMLNSEYACMTTLARLAEIAGDEGVRAQALYRAARRICPTLARLKTRAYYEKTGQLEEPGKMRAATGFNEQGACFQARGGRVRDCDLFDMSQGMPQDLLALYEWYGWGELREDYFADVRAANPAKDFNYIMAAVASTDPDAKPADMAATLAACAANKGLNTRLPTDWGAMVTGSYMEYILAKLAGSPRISDCRGVYLHDAIWDPASRKLKLDYTPGPGARLAVRAPKGPERALPVAPAGTRREETLAF